MQMPLRRSTTSASVIFCLLLGLRGTAAGTAGADDDGTTGKAFCMLAVGGAGGALLGWNCCILVDACSVLVVLCKLILRVFDKLGGLAGDRCEDARSKPEADPFEPSRRMSGLLGPSEPFLFGGGGGAERGFSKVGSS